jgi:hypothetical protein
MRTSGVLGFWGAIRNELCHLLFVQLRIATDGAVCVTLLWGNQSTKSHSKMVIGLESLRFSAPIPSPHPSLSIPTHWTIKSISSFSSLVKTFLEEARRDFLEKWEHPLRYGLIYRPFTSKYGQNYNRRYIRDPPSQNKQNLLTNH